EALAAECRFSDCRHESEPGCGVLAAVADGRIAARRLAGYSKLQREVEHQTGVVADHERRAQGRQQQRMYRAIQNEKRRRR
ncbi:MAG TPA: GTPase RsgA, partial [Acidimicrobiia bacterium]|nr:GTPase RsgA [Acidimicrobiia bacterium]